MGKKTTVILLQNNDLKNINIDYFRKSTKDMFDFISFNINYNNKQILKQNENSIENFLLDNKNIISSEIVFIRLFDSKIYLSFLQNSIKEMRKRKISHLFVKKKPITNNICTVIDREFLYKEIMVDENIVNNIFFIKKDAMHIYDKDISDYKYALKSPKEIFSNPTKIYLQLLDNCSKKCPKCLYESRDKYVSRRDGFKIDFRLLKKLFKEISNFKEKPIVEPSFDCEPLMYREFDKLLKLASKYKIILHIVTNGMLLSEEKIDLLLNCEEVVFISDVRLGFCIT